MLKKIFALALSVAVILAVCSNGVFATSNDGNFSAVSDDSAYEVKNIVYFEDFESVAEGNVKVPITNNSENLYMYSNGKYNILRSGPAPKGNTWGMFTNDSYATHKLVDGEYIAIDGAHKKGAYCGDNHFPIKAIKGEYTHQYYTDFNTDSSLISTVNVKPHSGNTMIGMGQLYRTSIKEITGLKANTNYKLSIWVYQANPCGFVHTIAVADNYDGVRTNGTTAFLKDTAVLGSVVHTNIEKVYGEWTEIAFNFSTLDKTTVYLHISQNGLGTNGNKSMIFVDDITIVEADYFEDFENVAEGNVKTPIVNNSENLYMYSGGKYSLVRTADAPKGNTWGMFTKDSYATHKLVDGEYIAIDGAHKKGTYGGDNHFPIKAIKGEYTHQYYTDFNTDSSLISTVNVKPHSGNTMIGMGQLYRTSIKEITGLKANTNYKLSIWVYQANPCGYVHTLAVADNYDGLQTNSITPFLDNTNVLGYSDYSKKEKVYGKWTELTIDFSTLDKTTVYLHISQNGLGTNGNKSMIFVDDITIVEASENYVTAKEIISNNLVTTQSVVEISGNSAILNYTASGLEFILNCEGTVKANFTAFVHNSNFDLRFALYVNGKRENDIVLTGDTNEFILASNLPKGEYTFKFERMTEAQIGNVYFNYLSFNGELKTPPAKKDLFIDFYGDSITAGWGTTDYLGNPINAYQFMDGTITYAALTAKNLNANFNAFGYSGWGVAVTGASDGKGDKNMTTIYSSLPKNVNADYVVINLGTNDANKYLKAGLTEQQVKDAFFAYAKQIRLDYGAETPIIFAYGMMTQTANVFIEYAVEKMNSEGDTNVYSVNLPEGKSGGANHPNAEEQYAAAIVLTEFIKGLSNTVAGDITGDKITNLKDLVALAQYVAKWENVFVNLKTCDINGDSEIDLVDVNHLALYLAGWNIVINS